MKVRDYVDRYYEGIEAGTDEAAQGMADTLFMECESEVNEYRRAEAKSGRKINRNDVENIVEKYNRKGNVIRNAMNMKAGKTIVQMDWFWKCVKIEQTEDTKSAKNELDDPNNWE